jgi:hypothetical protein
LKTKLSNYFQVCWYVLTEVPGWPDAPFRARFLRSLPVVFPFLAACLVLTWRLAVYAPEARREQASMRPLLELDREVSTLQIVNSDQQVAQLAQRAESAQHLLLENRQAVPALLHDLKKTAQDRGWDLSTQTADPVEDVAKPEAQVQYVTVRGRLRPRSGNTDTFPSLLSLLEQFSSNPKRIELTRLAIRVDDVHGQTAELSLRLACSAVHAQTP